MEHLDLLLRLSSLDRLPRAGWLQAGPLRPETVAGHSLSTAYLALLLGPEVEPGLDVDRAVALAVVHDAGEALLTDLPHSAARLLGRDVKRAAEAQAGQELFEDAVLALARHREALAKDTREARFVGCCDQLQLGVQLLAYRRAGVRGLDEFVRGLRQLDTSEFAPCGALQGQLLDALERDAQA